MGKFIDLTGQKFGKLTALYRGEKAERGRSVKWYCLCDCGNYCWIGSNALRTGNSKSCGCLKKETSSKSGRKNKGRRKRFNSFEFMDDCVIGYDNKGNSFYIDTEDLDKVQKYCWYKNKEDALRARLQGEAKYYGLDAPQRHLFKQYGIEVNE